jgi:hypothetical protein
MTLFDEFKNGLADDKSLSGLSFDRFPIWSIFGSY